MKILVVHNTLNDSKSVSGALRHFLTVANQWNDWGHQTDFLMAKCAFGHIGPLVPKSRMVSSDGIFDATSNIRQTWRNFPAYGWRILTALCSRKFDQYDFVIASSPFIFEALPAMLVSKRVGAHLGVKVHHVLNVQRRVAAFSDRLFLLTEKIVVRWVNKRFDLVICGTPLIAEHYATLERSLGLNPVDPLVCGYGVDIAAIESVGTGEKLYDAVYLGRLHEHKGVLDLPEIWKQVVRDHPAARLLVIGEGPHGPKLKEMMTQEGLGRNVVFEAGVTEERKNRLISQARVGLSVSYEEGWGLSVNEFLAASMPVLSYQLPVFEMVFPGVLQTVPLGDKAAFAQALSALLRQPDRQKELGRAGRAFVARYDVAEVAGRELRAMEAVLQARK